MFFKAGVYEWPKHSNLKANLGSLLVGVCSQSLHESTSLEWNLWNYKIKTCEDFILNYSRRNDETYYLEIIVLAVVVKLSVTIFCIV